MCAPSLRIAAWVEVSGEWLCFGVSGVKRSGPEKNAMLSDGTIQAAVDELELLRRLRRLSQYRW